MDSRRPPSRVSGPADRAQSVFDYAIGVSLFIVVVVGVIAFVPVAFSALNDTGGVSSGDELVADRAADNLVESAFVSSTSGHLDPECVAAYFDGTSECGFRSGTTLAPDAGVAAHHPINVTVEADINQTNDKREALCWDRDAGELETVASGACGGSADVRLAAGPDPTENENFVTVSRSATLAGEEVYVLVRSW